MPELAEVEYYRRQWDPGLGRTVSRVATRPGARVFREVPARAVERALQGRRLLSSRTHGKQMLFEFSGGAWLGLHLGMTGELRTAPAESDPEKHDHLVLVLDSFALVFRDPRMFGALRLDLGSADEPPDWWRALPPQPLDAGFTKRRLREFARRFPKTPLKTLLLDQRGFPGIGNWMADEVCWQSRLPPRIPAGELADAELDALWKTLRRVCREALRTIGVDWSDPPGSWLMTHRWRDGGVCPRRGCRAGLRREDLCGRTTCWCPRCQA